MKNLILVSNRSNLNKKQAITNMNTAQERKETDAILSKDVLSREEYNFERTEKIDFTPHQIKIRKACVEDAQSIQSLYQEIYSGKYPEEFARNIEFLKQQISSPLCLWIVAHEEFTKVVVGAVVFYIDAIQRIGKAAGIVVSPKFRSHGVGTSLIRFGIEELTWCRRQVDVIYALTRTITEAPAHVLAQAGFLQMGFLPNAVQVDDYEHLNLEIFVTQSALARRRKKPLLYSAFSETYALCRTQLDLERPYIITEQAPLSLQRTALHLDCIEEESLVQEKFEEYIRTNRIRTSFFPFHKPNRIFMTQDKGSEVFVWLAEQGTQGVIIGYRTDLVQIHHLLNSLALSLQKMGVVYVEILVDAYDYQLQQQACTARFLPSAYFPAMRLNADGLRDDYFILNRTFQILDFSESYFRGDNLPFLKAYLQHYRQRYMNPISNH